VFATYDKKPDVKLTLSFAQMQDEMSILVDDAAG
jgi:hypothetical protein